MISFMRLGDYGRLGNQMFQYAALKGVGIKCGYEVHIPRYPGLDLIEVFEIPEPELTADEVLLLVNRYSERGYAFNEDVFGIPDFCGLHGYFQSERYFEHCIPQVRESFTLVPRVAEKADAASKDLLGGVWTSRTTVSLHVRRGDYLANPTHHPVCSVEYYQRALDHLESLFGRLTVVVFSDDLAWCKETFRGRRFRFAEGNDLGTDMALMGRCDHHIIANSSFSWWSAWLDPAPDTVVIAPEIWFGTEARRDTRDQIPSRWLRM